MATAAPRRKGRRFVPLVSSPNPTNPTEEQVGEPKKIAPLSEASEPGSGSDSDLLVKLSDFVKKDPKKSKNTEKVEPKKAKKKANKPVTRSKTISMTSLVKSKPPAPTANNRVWSEDDEIALLKGLIDFKTEKKVESATGDFYEFIKKSLHFDADRTQLSAKVRKLKSKYLEKDGTDLVFSNVHAEKIYELSKQLWGGISDSHISGKESKKNHSKKRKVEKKKMDVSMFAQHGGLNINDPMIVPEETLKAGLALLDDSTRAEFDEMRKELKKQEILVYKKTMEFRQKEASAALEAVRSSGV